MPDIYKRLGVRPIINARGTHTRLGGTLIRPEVLDAMREAASAYVVLDELQDKASEVIARATGAEAGIVVGGAEAGLLIGTAAILAGTDPAKIAQLPVTDGMANEAIMHRAHRNGYDHGVRAAGARIVDIGYGASTLPYQLQSAINECTALVVYLMSPWASHAALSLEKTCEIAHQANIPVVVDAAAMLPPTNSLRRFIAEGADLVTFSGGKGLRGPQASGILAGRADLIMSAALQQLDLDEHWSVWDPPANLIDRAKLRGFPRHGIGRGFKVAREEIVALLVALRSFIAGDYRADIVRCTGYLNSIADGLVGVRGVKTQHGGGVDEDRFPTLELLLDESELRITAFEVSRRLRAGTPAVYVNENRLQEGVLILHALGLEERLIEPLTQQLREVLGG